MTTRERFNNTLNFKKADRAPIIEWAAWWNLTVERWQKEGLNNTLDYVEIMKHFGLDIQRSQWVQPWFEDDHEQFRSDPEKFYPAISERIRTLDITDYMKKPLCYKSEHDAGEMIVWYTYHGCFWFPRVLFGIEQHLYSFYDYPELYHRICRDLTDFNLRAIRLGFQHVKPDFISLAEDMSYNLGPMLSEEHFNEFLLPYYLEIAEEVHSHGVKVFVDSDGDVTQMIPWLIRAGIDGILPLERQAGVNVVSLREEYPDFLFLGAFDKMCMKHGEAAMRAEFERLLPLMKSGGFILSVDHQTPPDVSLENYKTYIRLFNEYARKVN